MKYLMLSLGVALLLCLSSICMGQTLPLKPDKTISFTTDRGTYMDVDVSPDGRTILFNLLGDLYTIPSSGGKATQLTRGLAINLRPTLSPDGK